MRILLTAHQFFPKHGSGTEVLTRDTAAELLKRGHEVFVITTDRDLRAEAGEIVYEDYEYQGIKVRALGLPNPSAGVDRIRHEYENEPVARHMRGYLAETRPDVAHIFHPARLSASIIDVFKEFGLPVVYTPTDFWAICVRNTLMKVSGELCGGPDDISSNCLECRQVERLLPEDQLPKTPDKAKFYREIAERALEARRMEHPSMPLVRQMLARTKALRERFNSVDAVLAPTQLMHRMLTGNGIEPGLVNLSPYGMDLSHFQGAEPSRSKDGRMRFGYVGTFHPQKGVHLLIEAFKSLPHDVDATLRLCGDFSYFPEYSREIYDLARPDPRINFAGTFPNEKIAEELK
ncbi:MAG: glycosyltransferase, partial [Rubrobacteraceae bacterium]